MSRGGHVWSVKNAGRVIGSAMLTATPHFSQREGRMIVLRHLATLDIGESVMPVGLQYQQQQQQSTQAWMCVFSGRASIRNMQSRFEKFTDNVYLRSRCLHAWEVLYKNMSRTINTLRISCPVPSLLQLHGAKPNKERNWAWTSIFTLGAHMHLTSDLSFLMSCESGCCYKTERAEQPFRSTQTRNLARRHFMLQTE